MKPRPFELSQLPGTFGIARLGAHDDMPSWVAGTFTCVARTPRELSIICDYSAIPPKVRDNSEWRCLRLEGTFSFDQVGVIAVIATILARAQVSILPVATFETDYILVQTSQFEVATKALRDAGQVLITSEPTIVEKTPKCDIRRRKR